MSLSPLQVKQVFALNCWARLVLFAATKGLNLVAGEAWRSPATCAIYAEKGLGIKNSLHTLRLGFDGDILDSAGQLSRDAKVYGVLGEFWKKLSVGPYTCYWGGDFQPKADIYHFSVGHQGIK